MNLKNSCIYNAVRLIWRTTKKIAAYSSYLKFKIIKPILMPSRDNEKNITISFTTYPARVKCLPMVIGSLVRQTRKPNRIVLYLSKLQFADLNNPIFSSIKKQGVEIKLCDSDLRSHKKYLYAIQEFPEDLIITVDDDIIYDKNLVDDLYQSYLRHPNAVSAKRVHRIRFDSANKVKPYLEWDIATQELIDTESFELVATGCGGILYPPYGLIQEYSNVEVIRETCMNADDLWLKVMELMNGTPVVLAKSKKYKLNHVWETECNGLALDNVEGSGNDKQLEDICSRLHVDLYKVVTRK